MSAEPRLEGLECGESGEERARVVEFGGRSVVSEFASLGRLLGPRFA